MTWGFVFVTLFVLIFFLTLMLWINKGLTKDLDHDIREAEKAREEQVRQAVVELGHCTTPPGFRVYAYSVDNGPNTTSEVRWAWEHNVQGGHSGFHDQSEALEDAWGCFNAAPERRRPIAEVNPAEHRTRW